MWDRWQYWVARRSPWSRTPMLPQPPGVEAAGRAPPAGTPARHDHPAVGGGGDGGPHPDADGDPGVQPEDMADRIDAHPEDGRDRAGGRPAELTRRVLLG